MTATLNERIMHGNLDTQEVPSAAKIVDTLLASVEAMSDEEVRHRLAVLVDGAKRIDLSGHVRKGDIDDYVDEIPQLDELLSQIHDTADHILHDTPEFDHDSLMTVNNLGIAADLTQDKNLLDSALDALSDTNDYSLEMMRHAMKVARDGDDLFIDVYRRLKSGKPAVKAVVVAEIPMSKRPDFVGEDAVFSTWTRKLGSPATKAVTMDSYEDLFGDVRPNATETKTHQFTTDDVKRTTIRRALNDFTARYKTNR